MSLNNIVLPAFVMANFYNDKLVILKDELNQTNSTINIAAEPKDNIVQKTEPLVETATTTISFLGNNTSHICLIVHQPNDVFINDNCLQLVTKMLGACKLTLNDVAIVNTAHKTIHISQLQQQLQPTKIILFNVNTQHLQIPFIVPNYQLQAYNGYTLVQVAALENMLGETLAEKTEKKKLWDCLKSLFNL